jgi:hypothetical protein
MPNPARPVKNPRCTWVVSWVLSFNREESISPAIRISGIRYQKRGTPIFNERMITIPVNAPAPTECREIFHQKLMTVTINVRKDIEKMNAFKNSGI